MQSIIGGRMLPETAGVSDGASEINIPKTHDADIAALITGMRAISALAPASTSVDLATLGTTVVAQGVITALNSGSIALQSGTVADVNSPGVVPLGTAALYIKINGNSTNSIFLNIAGTSVGWKAIATA